MPEHNDMAVCKHCGGRIVYIEETANAGGGHYEVLNAWWAHDRHPRDNHDGEPWPPLHDLGAASDPIERARLARENLLITLARVGQALQAIANTISGRR